MSRMEAHRQRTGVVLRQGMFHWGTQHSIEVRLGMRRVYHEFPHTACTGLEVDCTRDKVTRMAGSCSLNLHRTLPCTPQRTLRLRGIDSLQSRCCTSSSRSSREFQCRCRSCSSMAHRSMGAVRTPCQSSIRRSLDCSCRTQLGTLNKRKGPQWDS